MKRTLFQYAFLCTLLSVLCILTGCSVKSEKSLHRWAKSNYGSSKILSKDSGEKSLTLTLEDKEYKFTYHVTSSLSAFIVDGSSFGDTESSSSDFPACYLNCFLAYHMPELSRLETQYSVTIKPYTGYDRTSLLEITAGDAQQGTAAALEAAKICKAYDNRHFWKHSILPIIDPDGKDLGCYSFSEDRCLTPEEIRTAEITTQASFYCKDAVLVQTEDKTFADTGLEPDEVDTSYNEDAPQKPEDPVRYYWFESGGKRFFIADVLLNNTGTCFTNVYEAIPDAT